MVMENASVVARSQGEMRVGVKWDSGREFQKDEAVCILTMMIVLRNSTCSENT